jgi:SAM-dependent methyltransferase
LSAAADPFPAFYSALEARHRAELSFAEVRRALSALSSLYVERRGRLAGGGALEGRGKRAAFALYYGPLHFLLLREIVRGLGTALARPRRILDLGCGTGSAGAAWALECAPAASVTGVDVSGWAVDEARFTWRKLGIAGTATRADAARTMPPDGRCGWLAAFTVNELPEPGRAVLLERLLRAAATGSPVLVVEPIARRMNPWWPAWRDAFAAAGGREDEWRVRAALPESLALLGRAAGLDPRELSGRSLALSPSPPPSAPPASGS